LEDQITIVASSEAPRKAGEAGRGLLAAEIDAKRSGPPNRSESNLSAT